MKKSIAITLGAVALFAAGCSGTSDRSTVEDLATAKGMTTEQFLACEDFVNGKDSVSAEDPVGRADFARDVNEWAQQGGPELKDAGDSLARTASSTATAWEMSLDLFAAKCMQLGWPTQSEIDAAK